MSERAAFGWNNLIPLSPWVRSGETRRAEAGAVSFAPRRGHFRVGLGMGGNSCGRRRKGSSAKLMNEATISTGSPVKIGTSFQPLTQIVQRLVYKHSSADIMIKFDRANLAEVGLAPTLFVVSCA